MDAPWWSRTFWSTWRCSWRWTAKLIARSRRWCARWDLESLCRRSVSVYSDWMKKVIIRQRKHGDHQRKRGTDIDVAGIDVIGVWNIRQRIQHDAVVIDCEESNDSDDHITSRVSFFFSPSFETVIRNRIDRKLFLWQWNLNGLTGNDFSVLILWSILHFGSVPSGVTLHFAGRLSASTKKNKKTKQIN